MSSRSFRGKSRSNGSARSRGFTIFEVMISTLVLALVITSSITVMQSGFRAMDTARNTTIAGQILQSVMEDLRMLPWSSTTSGANSITLLQTSNNNVDGNVTLGASFTNGDAAAAAMVSRFTITRNITDVGTDMKNIALTAAWTGIDGRRHSLTYTSYYGKNGLHDYFVR